MSPTHHDSKSFKQPDAAPDADRDNNMHAAPASNAQDGQPNGERPNNGQSDNGQSDSGERNLAGAKHYALGRLEQELPERFGYHSLEHTRDNVYPIALRIAALEGVSGRALYLLKTAIYFHDLGFSEPPHTAQNHEERSAAIAQQVLVNFGYSNDDITLIKGMILATKLPQQPKTLLERIIADADLSVLGQRDFLKQNRALRAELESGGMDTDDHRWLTGQYNFLSGHRYFTRAARQLLSAQKAVNLASLRTLIDELSEAS
jgi:uncharacterized protein